ncbi:MAG: ComEA family DNA-binding protein [Cyanobacteria bacterium P01_C01_bin.72]
MFKLSQIGIRHKIANDPYYRFQSLKEVAIAAELGIKIDANLATVDDWLRLPGFSIRQARSLVELVRMGVQFVCIDDVAAAIGVSVIHLQPYEQVLTFAYYDRLSPLSPVKINVNSASTEELTTIPEMTCDLAQAIISDRSNHGKYSNIVDLSSRLNLDSNLTSGLMHYLRF